ncbi:hypothetical protein L1887_18185 [Cichorium endivia]|nr:hypothetical protein L1887_18185 [Cichorium endivia]
MGESQNSQGATDLEVVDKFPKTENEIECVILSLLEFDEVWTFFLYGNDMMMELIGFVAFVPIQTDVLCVFSEDKDVVGCLEAMSFNRTLVWVHFFACNKNEELTVNCLQNHVRTFDDALNHPRCSSTLLLTFKTEVELPANPVHKVDDPTFFSGGGIFSFTLANTSDSQANPRPPLITNTYETEVQLPSTLTVVLLSQKISWASRSVGYQD